MLLDEIEKAHKDVHEIFFQVFDKGVLVDSKGQTADFKNTIILLTSNVGSEMIMEMWKDPELVPTEPTGVAKALRKPLREVFPAALLGRLVVVPYYPLTDEVLDKIVRLQISRITKRLAHGHRANLEYDDSVLELIKTRCQDRESGARTVDAILTHTILPEISRELLARIVQGSEVRRVSVTAGDGEFQYAFD